MDDMPSGFCSALVAVIIFFVIMLVLNGLSQHETQVQTQTQIQIQSNNYYAEIQEIAKNDYTYEDIIYKYGLEKGFELIKILEEVDN